MNDADDLMMGPGPDNDLLAKRREFTQRALQGVADSIGVDLQRDRQKSQMTLGGLITALEALAPDRLITGFGGALSYRGYYCDLAFAPMARERPVAELLHLARSCMGRVFEGYKGGDFLMGEMTPIWIAGYGESSCPRLMSLDTSELVVKPITELEPPYQSSGSFGMLAKGQDSGGSDPSPTVDGG